MATNDLERLNSVDLDTPYETAAQVASAIGELEHALTATAPVSRLGVFVTAYRYITLELQQRLHDDVAGVTHHFQDPAWVEKYLVEFANLYRAALSNYKHKQRTRVAAPWLLAFDAAVADETVVLQDLLLGINAHINNDLPQALQAVTIDPEREQRHTDHDAVNAALDAATDTVEEHLSHIYGSFIGLLDWAGGPVDEDITNFSFRKAREEAWNAGVALVDKQETPQEIEQKAAVLARLILTINTTAPELTAALHWFEGMWQEAFPASDGDTAAAPPIAAPESIKAAAVAPAPAGSPLAEAMDRLTTIIGELDQQRPPSRHALSTTLYREILRQVSRAIAAGQFQQPQWIAEVQDNCVRLYLNALQAFRTGEMGKVPASWRIVFEGAQLENDVSGAPRRIDLLVPQVLALGVTAHLAHDAPIALLRTRFYADVAQHQPDFDRLAAITKRCLEAAITAATNRYPRELDALEDLPAAMSKLLYCFDCAQTAQVGCTNAAALAAARKTDSHGAFRTLDRETSERAQCIVVPGLVQHDWMIPALRQYEKGWAGPWSEWVVEPATLYGHVLGDAVNTIAPALRSFLCEPDARRAAGTVRLVRGRGWWPPFLADVLGFPPAGKAIPLHLEVVAQDDQEHWFQILGTHAWATQHWAYNGNLVVAYGPLRFTFKVMADAGALRFEQIGTALLALPLPRRMAPEIQVRVKASGKRIDLNVSVRSALVGDLVQYAGQLVVQ